MNTQKPLNKILLTEDEADIRTIAKIALIDVGNLDVMICSTGQETLQNVESFKPDLIILDVMMPGMDGIEIFKTLQERPTVANIPVVFMTAKVQPKEIAMYRRLGVIDVIVKPFDPMTLADQVKQIWQKIQS